MPAVTQRIDNYLGGVSRQSDDKKIPGQVRECLNGYPDATFGLTKRPGLKWIANLGSGTTYDSSHWFYINRDATNKYIGCITPKPGGGPHGTVAIWNATTGAACTVTENSADYDYLTGTRTDYHVLNLQDRSIITNSLITVAKQNDPAFVAKKQATIMISGAVVTGEVYKVVIDGTTKTYTAQSGDGYNEVLSYFQTQIDAISGLTAVKYSTTVHVTKATAIAVTAEGGPDNSKLTVFQDEVDNVTQLPLESFDGHTVKIVNTQADEDTYFVKFSAADGTSGPGSWPEGLDPSKSPGLDASTMPHELVNTGTNAFTFRQATWTARTVGDDVTNTHPSFVGGKIEQSFFHSNRLGFLSDDKVSMSQSGQRFNLYFTSAKVVTDSDPIDLRCSTIRPAALHSVIPTTQGLVLFSKNQQFLMSSDDGVLTPAKTTIRAISNYEVDTQISPVDIGTHINFISKTPSYTRVFGMATRGQDENPEVVDIGKIVNEWVPDSIDTLIASAQNQFLAMSDQSSDKIYFYRTGGEDLQAWFNWQLCGNVQAMAVDSDDMYAVTKQGTQFTLSKASLSQSPEDAIIVNNDGQKINPCMDLYAAASSVSYDSTNLVSKCYIPWDNITTLTPVIVIKGTTATGQFIDSGFTTTPTAKSDGGGAYFEVPRKDLSGIASDVIVGWKYDFDITLPKTYFRTDEEQTLADYAASLTISRMKFAVGLSGVMGFKMKSTGVRQGKREYTGYDLTVAQPGDFPFVKDDLSYVDRDQVKLKINNIEETGFTFVDDTTIRITTLPIQTITAASGQTTFTWTFDRTDVTKIRVLLETGVGTNTYVQGIVGTDYAITGKNVIFIGSDGNPSAVTTGARVKIYSADDIVIYLDEWYNLSPTQQADTYLANDIGITEQSVFTLPIHQKTNNFQVRLFNDSPFPVSLNSMMWEGNYSPRFYKRK